LSVAAAVLWLKTRFEVRPVSEEFPPIPNSDAILNLFIEITIFSVKISEMAGNDQK